MIKMIEYDGYVHLLINIGSSWIDFPIAATVSVDYI